jgi:hypothetical protein
MSYKSKSILTLCALFVSAQASAECPDLNAHQLASFISPWSGASHTHQVGGVTYKRQPGVTPGSGLMSTICSTVTKTCRADNKTYSGVESSLVAGKVQCDYTPHLTKSWHDAGIKSFTIAADIASPLNAAGAACPKLDYNEVKAMNCEAKLHTLGKLSWKANSDQTVCGILKGLVNKNPAGHISGNLSNPTKFSHTCTYTYHEGSGKSDAQLILNGKQD